MTGDANLSRIGLGLGENVLNASIESLNLLLADTIALRDLYKKHHWQTTGPTFRSLHRLFDEHHAAQVEIVDALAERVMTLGGVALATSQDVSEATRIPRAPTGREAPTDQIRRLLAAHQQIISDARSKAREAADNGDDGTNDLLVSQVVRTGELQVWMLREHLGEGNGS